MCIRDRLLMGLFPEGSAPAPESLGLVVGAAAILGHNFPCWRRFKGGKGIATTAGVVGGLAPIPFAFCLGSWVLAFAVTRYVSLASIAAAVTLPIAAAAWPRCSSIIAADRIAASGLAKPLPTMSGALPCTGSNIDGWSPSGLMLPLAAKPMLPVMMAARSERMSTSLVPISK